jgi:DNA-binding response OmpR family regulator
LRPRAEGGTRLAFSTGVPKRILIVEDEESLAFAVSAYLSRAGYAVDLTSELEEAKALTAATPYDLVLSDLRLNGAQGAEGLELLRHLETCQPAVPTILLTGISCAEADAAAAAQGATLVLEKPQGLAELRSAIEALLGASR